MSLLYASHIPIYTDLKEVLTVEAHCRGHIPQLSQSGLSVQEIELVGFVRFLMTEREEGVVALHLPFEPLKTCIGLELVLRCEPSTYQPIG